MSRIKRARPALVVVVVALIAAVAGTALAGSGTDANTSASAKKTAEKALKKAKKALKKAKQVEKQEGPKGEKGDQGDPATRLFATVKANGNLNSGQGATAATKDSEGDYTVTFNRSLVNCVAVGSAGTGNPPGLPNQFGARINVTVNLQGGNSNQLKVSTWNNGVSDDFEDSGFLIAVFC